MIQLKRPIVFFDLETTGVDVAKDRIVEISCLKINTDYTEEVRTQRVNPLIPIPEGASAVHGITDKAVANCPTFAQIAQAIYGYIKDCDLGGFNNIRFDVPLLVEEFLRCGVEVDFTKVSVVDASIIFTKHEPRDLASALSFYCGKELEGAHAAENDIRATWDVFQAQVSKYGLTDIDGIAKSYVWREGVLDYAGKVALNKNGDAVFTFGKHKDKRLVDNHDYCIWMLNQDFTLNTKAVIKRFINV